MGFLSKIFGVATKEPIEAIGGVLDELFTSDEEKLDKKILLQRLAMEPAKLQVELSKIEAQHRSIFVAGPRPFIMWVCGVALAFSFIVNPLLQWITGKTGPLILTDVIMELTLALLGLGALRTVEKLNGRTK